MPDECHTVLNNKNSPSSGELSDANNMHKTQFNHIQDIWKATNINPVQGCFIFCGVIAIALSVPSLQKHQAQIEADKEQINQATQQRRHLEIQFELEREQAVIAEKRYQSCLPVVGQYFKNGTHYFSGIRQGAVILDRITNSPLIAGTIICDGHGMTAVISNDGTPQHFAFTGNRQVILERLKRFRGSQYSQPVIKD